MELMEKKFYDALKKYLPPNALAYCYDLWMKYRFRLKIVNNRRSKLGDYRYDPAKDLHIITVNRTLNPYNFLITYIHETAHLAANKEYGRKKKPHGKEWKSVYKRLMQPLLSESIFPADLLQPLRRHMQNPAASSYSDEALCKALRRYDAETHLEMLDNIQIGEEFIFHKRLFKKEGVKRTRVLCCEVVTGKKYLIPKLAMVLKAGSSG